MTNNSELSLRNESPQIVVHWLERSRAQRLIWLLEECNVPYDIKVYKRGGDHGAPPEMKQVHPLGKSPILTIKAPDQTEPLVMAESGAIFEYLVDHFAPHLAPKRYKNGYGGQVCGESESWLRYRYYMHYAEGTLMSLLMRKTTLSGVKGGDTSNVDAVLNNLAKTHLDFLESQIGSAPGNGQYLCGQELTAADILMCFPLQIIQSSMGGLAQYPEIEAYLKRMISTRAYNAAVKQAEAASGEDYHLV